LIRHAVAGDASQAPMEQVALDEISQRVIATGTYRTGRSGVGRFDVLRRA